MKMATAPTTKSHYERVLLKIDARSLRENHQQKRIDCLKPRSNKNRLECKKCGCNKFYVPKRLLFVIWSIL